MAFPDICIFENFCDRVEAFRRLALSDLDSLSGDHMRQMLEGAMGYAVEGQELIRIAADHIRSIQELVDRCQELITTIQDIST